MLGFAHQIAAMGRSQSNYSDSLVGVTSEKSFPLGFLGTFENGLATELERLVQPHFVDMVEYAGWQQTECSLLIAAILVDGYC